MSSSEAARSQWQRSGMASSGTSLRKSRCAAKAEHLNPSIPDFVPVAFGTSYGTPQTVEVNVRRALGAALNWQVEGSLTVHTGTTIEFNGGERYGRSGIYYRASPTARRGRRCCVRA
jgi:hypothetical protein